MENDLSLAISMHSFHPKSEICTNKGVEERRSTKRHGSEFPGLMGSVLLHYSAISVSKAELEYLHVARPCPSGNFMSKFKSISDTTVLVFLEAASLPRARVCPASKMQMTTTSGRVLVPYATGPQVLTVVSESIEGAWLNNFVLQMRNRYNAYVGVLRKFKTVG